MVFFIPLSDVELQHRRRKSQILTMMSDRWIESTSCDLKDMWNSPYWLNEYLQDSLMCKTILSYRHKDVYRLLNIIINVWIPLKHVRYIIDNYTSLQAARRSLRARGRPKVPWMFPESFINVSWMFPECHLHCKLLVGLRVHESVRKFPPLYLPLLAHLQPQCIECSVNIQWRFSENSVNTQWTCSEHSVNMQWTLRDHSVIIPWTFSEHSVNIQYTFSEHAVQIQRTFREPSVNIQWTCSELSVTKVNIQWTFSEHSANIQ
jgi:hypothetical protein